VVQYSDSIFHEAAILWLIKTDQVSGLTAIPIKLILYQPIHTLRHGLHPAGTLTSCTCPVATGNADAVML
ncbi:hypothetical protein F5141DRAFT_1000855, partial [Pisolithus sp. B1]